MLWRGGGDEQRDNHPEHHEVEDHLHGYRSRKLLVCETMSPTHHVTFTVPRHRSVVGRRWALRGTHETAPV
jgi:hypothetical protein